ncbi:MAG TPA: hypothetical protein VKT77_07975 [Chthonomonadaceae bacterium]|nr:hypothetical protein [Chthonomonadaceae bacterium]
MNETERDRILRMVAEGTLRPHEAAHLLAALADQPAASKKKKEGEKASSSTMEVEMERPDGSHYTVKVPPSLVPMLWEITKASVRESARSAARDTWDGMKAIVRKKSRQVRDGVRDRIAGSKGPAGPPQPAIPPAERQATAARRQILELVQSGTITADDAGRLIKQIDAHAAYQMRGTVAQ